MFGFVEVRPNERRIVRSAFVGLLGVTAGHTLIETARDALFLAKIPASRLPWVYLVLAGVGLAFGELRRSRSAPTKSSLARGLAAAAVVTAVFWLLARTQNTWVAYALYIWSGTFAAWAIGEFWANVSLTFDMTQAKRVYSLIGAGAVLGAVLGSAAARALAGAFDVAHLLLAAALLFAATGAGPARALAIAAAGARATASLTERKRAAASADTRTVREILDEPYTRRLAVIAFVATIVFTLTDFIFKSAVALHVPAADLGAFFATTYLTVNAFALVAQLAGVRLAVRYLGVHGALLVTPLLLAGAALGVAALPLLATAVVLRGADGALRHSLHRTSTELLFVPLADATRARTKSVVEFLGQRGGQVVASLLLLGLVALHGDSFLGAITAALALVWLSVARGVRGAYLDVFRKTLREGRLEDGGELPILDLSALETLFAALNSQHDAEVLGALDLLAAQGRERLIPGLVLYHPSKVIVLRALALLVAESRADVLPIVDRLTLTHADAEVRAAALRARCTLEPDEELLRERLRAEHEEVRATALAALVARGWISEGERAAALTALAGGNAVVRRALADAIALEPAPDWRDVLMTLAADEDRDVRASAARAMGSAGDESFITPLLALIDRWYEGSSAQEALAVMGVPAMRALDHLLGDENAQAERRWAAARTLARFPSEDAAPALMSHVSRTPADGQLQTRIARALRSLRAVDPLVTFAAPPLVDACHRALTDAITNLAWRHALASNVADVEAAARATPARELLEMMLRGRETDSLARTFLWLGLLHPTENFAQIHRGLSSKNAKVRATSRELIEHVVAAPLRAGVAALVDGETDAERLSRGRAFLPAVPTTYEELLRVLIAEGGDLGSLTAYHAVEIGLVELGRSARFDSASEFAIGITAGTKELLSSRDVNEAS